MRLSPIYEQKLAESKQAGIQEGIQQGVNAERRRVIENLLRIRFGVLNDDLTRIIEPLSLLSPEEFTPLLLQLSPQELIDRFISRFQPLAGNAYCEAPPRLLID
ncbi:MULTISPECIES: hypothetical protein [Calothrix]|uniref:DUF4351 domain-containing protein n=2 Tax=Calothrix TaxID=1186 RepID=A0ABR8ABM0_9CYAN|nr:MULTISPECIES: hypothetical protein [Calothrix]MBD2197104.1 hypothetical protein [Calothrix parietina FACHB-288]MBD2225675.1 hypothetical protein [Calothrix anomala FACHB-343]